MMSRFDDLKMTKTHILTTEGTERHRGDAGASLGGDLSPRIWKWVLMVLTIIILMLLMGCSASWHVRQAVKKDPGMFKDTVTVVTVDTLRIDVPVVEWRDRLKRDTLVEYRQGETVIRYKYSTLTDTLVVEADCPDKEVVTRTETKTVPPVMVEEGWRSRLFYLLACIGLVMLVGLVLFMILRR